MTERCPTCRTVLLWTHGALRCVNGQCPGPPQETLPVHDSNPKDPR